MFRFQTKIQFALLTTCAAYNFSAGVLWEQANVILLRDFLQ